MTSVILGGKWSCELNMDTCDTDETLDRMFSLFVILLPILYQYRSFLDQISLGEFILVPFILLFLLLDCKRRTLYVAKRELFFYIPVIIISFFLVPFDYYSIADNLTVFARIIYYLLLILVARNHFYWVAIKPAYFRIVEISVVYLYIQFVYTKLTGDYLPTYISYNLINPSETVAGSLQIYYSKNFRPSSFFLEPSYFALYCLPYLCLKPYSKGKATKFLILFVTFSMILSSATSGIVASAVVILYIVIEWLASRGVRKFISLFVVIIFFLCFISYVLTLQSELYGIQRLQNTLRFGGSLNYRITRGIYIFSELPFIHKILGVGLNNIQPYMEYHNLSTMFDESNLNYMCSMLQVLNYSGVVGLILLFLYCGEIYKLVKTNMSLKLLFFIIVFVMCYESILFSYRFAFLYIILLAEKNIEKSRVVEI